MPTASLVIHEVQTRCLTTWDGWNPANHDVEVGFGNKTLTEGLKLGKGELGCVSFGPSSFPRHDDGNPLAKPGKVGGDRGSWTGLLGGRGWAPESSSMRRLGLSKSLGTPGNKEK